MARIYYSGSSVEGLALGCGDAIPARYGARCGTLIFDLSACSHLLSVALGAPNRWCCSCRWPICSCRSPRL